MPEIQIFECGAQTPARTMPCADGGGTIICYPLFDGAMAMRMRLETHGFIEAREEHDGLEINFCVSGRFESDFTPRDGVALKPGDMSVSRMSGVESESRFPLGHYEGVCLMIDCARAEAWMRSEAAPFYTDLAALAERLLGGRWYCARESGPRCEHVFREMYEAMPYFDAPYLRLKALELLMLLSRTSEPEEEPTYCSSRQIALARHLRDHLVSDRDGYESLAALAEAHAVSVSQLQKLFKRTYGTPVYRYLREYRLEQAALALAQGEKSVTEIALDAGYASASKFSENFRKRYGASPSAFRRNAKKA